MIDANGGGSFANIDRRSGFSVPSSHQSVKQTTSQEANIQPANEAEQTKSAGADSRANATVQIRQRSYVSSLWQGVLDRPSNGSREAGSQTGSDQAASKPEETGSAAIKAQAPLPVVKSQASSVAAEAQATTAETSKADFLPTIPQYVEDSIPAPRAQLHRGQQSPKVTSAQPSSVATTQPTHVSAQSNPAAAQPNRTSAQLRDTTLAKVLASPVSPVKAGSDHGSVSATSAAASGVASAPTNVGLAQHKAKLDRQAIMQQAALVSCWRVVSRRNMPNMSCGRVVMRATGLRPAVSRFRLRLRWLRRCRSMAVRQPVVALRASTTKLTGPAQRQ